MTETFKFDNNKKDSTCCLWKTRLRQKSQNGWKSIDEK